MPGSGTVTDAGIFGRFRHFSELGRVHEDAIEFFGSYAMVLAPDSVFTCLLRCTGRASPGEKCEPSPRGWKRRSGLSSGRTPRHRAPLIGNDWITLPSSAFIATIIAGSRPATNTVDGPIHRDKCWRCSRRNRPARFHFQAAGINCQDLTFVFQVVIDGPFPVGTQFRCPSQIDRAHLVSRRRVNRCRIVAIAVQRADPLGRRVVDDAVSVSSALACPTTFNVLRSNMVAFLARRR